MSQLQQSQKILLEKKINEIQPPITYVENKTLRQEVAEIVINFSNFYSNKQNVKKVKAGLTGLVDDLHMHAVAIKKARKKGVGSGIFTIMFPNASKGVRNANKKSNKTKRNS